MGIESAALAVEHDIEETRGPFRALTIR